MDSLCEIHFTSQESLHFRIVLNDKIMIYKRTISSSLFIFTVVTFGVFDIVCFCFALKALDVDQFCSECVIKMKYTLKFYL